MPILLPQLVQVSRSYRKYLPTALAPPAQRIILGKSNITIGGYPSFVIVFVVLEAVALEVPLFWFWQKVCRFRKNIAHSVTP